MRWLAWFILAYVALGLQVGLAPHLRYHGAAPNLVLLAVVYVGINAPRDAALLGGFCLGVVQDLATQQPPGLFALAYGLVAMILVGSHHLTSREHPLTHFALALVGGLVTAAVLLIHGWIHPPAPGAGLSVGTEFTRVLYTALLAPVVIGVLQRAKKFFAFDSQRRKARPWG
ncbi:MAG TPA: rod shape-determining protein MreD [Tepidisphaeraceae bacterium]|nr:rod shape-determining protein MreD [Tepidisphaeraceae bacterium]